MNRLEIAEFLLKKYPTYLSNPATLDEIRELYNMYCCARSVLRRSPNYYQYRAKGYFSTINIVRYELSLSNATYSPLLEEIHQIQLNQ